MERESLAMRQKLLSPEHPDVAKSLYLVGDRLRQEGDTKEAYTILTAALSIQRKVLGQDHPSTLYSMKSLGLTYEADHKWAEAEAIFREVLAGWRKCAGDEDLQTLYELRNLADALEGQGRWAQAEALHREALASWRKRAGDSDPETLYTMHRLGEALDHQRKWSESESVRREQVDTWRKRAGNDDPQTLFALRELGITLEYQWKWEEAEKAHREALASWRSRAGNDDPQTLYSLDRLARVLVAEAKWSEAEGIYREALNSRLNRAGHDDPQTLSEYDNLTMTLMQQKKFGETERFLAEAMTPAVIAQPSSSNMLIRRLEILGRQGRWQEAAATASLSVEYQPTDEFLFHTLAELLAITGNRPAYEVLCKKILATFTNTNNPYVDERNAKDCLFLPDSGADLNFVDELAGKSVSLGSGSPDLPYFQEAKAMSAYRLGHFTEAIEWAEKTLKGTIIYPNAHAYAILAMAHWQLGQKDVARMMLAKGDSLTPKISATRQDVALGESWVAWLAARISLDEAEQLIALDAATK